MGSNKKASSHDDAEAGEGGEGCCGEINDVRKKSGFTCSFLVFSALNVAMLVVGINATGACPDEPMVPTYLIVAGSTSLSLLLVRLLISHVLLPYLSPQKEEEEEEAGGEAGVDVVAAWMLAGLTIFDSLASIFSTIWLIVGSVYVYGSSPQYSDPRADDYCDEGAYMFAFVVITIGYVSLFLSILAAFCHCFFKKRS